MAAGLQPTTLPAAPPFQKIFRLRSTPMPAQIHFFKSWIVSIDMQSCFEFRPSRRPRLESARSKNLLRCLSEKRKSIPSWTLLVSSEQRQLFSAALLARFVVPTGVALNAVLSSELRKQL